MSYDTELIAEIAAGKMRNAWQVEDRPNQPDLRPAELRQGGWNLRSQAYRDGWERIFAREKLCPHDQQHKSI